ncbi:hypothetical protein Tco_1538616 [Tanacetum coccineum]
MTERNDYISVTRKNWISNDNEGRMTERNLFEIQGAFLVKIRDNTFNGTIGENAFEHINKFLNVVGPIKINRVSQDRFRLSIFPISLAGTAGKWFKKDCIGTVTTWEYLVEKFVQKFYQLFIDNKEMEAEEDDDPDDIANIFEIEGNLFDYKTPLNQTILKKKNEEYELNNTMTRDLEEPWLDNGVPYQLCDHICEPYHFKNGMTKWPTCSSDIDGFCNGGELPGMGSGKKHDLFPGSQVKMLNEVPPFTIVWKVMSRDQMANFKTEKAPDPYLDINRVFWRFEMMKYSFNDDEECIAIKESEYLNHSKDNLDPYQELLYIINEGWVVATPNDE